MSETNEHKTTIRFELTNEWGSHYIAETSRELHYDLESELGFIGEQLIAFLRQAGYYMKNSNLLMEDLTDEELDYLSGCLDEYRREDSGEK